jgi:hypothetical protein
MDFVQRNLINERNNLQIELAKANILIAQLNELSNKTLGSYIKKASGVDTGPSFIPAPPWNDPTPKNDVANLNQNAHQNYTFQNLEKLENRKQGIGRAVDQLTSRLVDAKYKRLVPKPTNEQAEYISSLENAVIALAESMNMSVEDLLNEDSIIEARVMTKRGVRRQRKFSTVASRRKEAEGKSVTDPNERQDETAGLVPVSPEHKAAYTAVRAHGGKNSDQLNTDVTALKGYEFARKHAIADTKRRELDRVMGLGGLKDQQEKEMSRSKNPTFTRDLENYIGPKTPHKFRKPLPLTMIKNKYNLLNKTKNLKPGNILDVSKNRSELFKNINKKK